MKKSVLVFLVAAMAVGCGKQPIQSPMAQVAEGQPIKPIHLRGMFEGAVQNGMGQNGGQEAEQKEGVTHIYLTDYVPTLAADTFDVVRFGGKTEEKVFGEMDLEVNALTDGKIQILSLQRGEEQVDVVALPKLKRVQAFVTMSADKDNITFGFENAVPAAEVTVMWQNKHIENEGVVLAAENGVYVLNLNQLKKLTGEKKGRSFLRVYASDGNVLYNDLLIPLQDMQPVSSATQLTREDHEAQVLYSLMVDRFENGNTQNDWKINSPEVMDIADYQGGDIAGITQKIRDGFFDELGVTTIWVSPITQNPYSAWGYYAFDFLPESTDEQPLFANKYDPTKNHSRFSGYHGYWPIYTTQLDKRLGTDAELREMLRVAHEHDLNVILDYVANHIHIESPVLQEHPDWITDSILPDGRRNFELWDEARLTTWFDKHIPTLDLEREEVYEPMTDSALTWINQFDFDGFRHDACKHIPECYWRTLTQKMKTQNPDRALWMIGETYGSPELIGSYVKSGMLDAQFDFNVYFTAIRAIANAGNDMEQVGKVILESLDAYDAHHTMGNISGNHDQVRFASLAGGAIGFDEDGKDVGWAREVGHGDRNKAFRRTILLEVLNLTIPGVPCIYQGDEYGQAGGGDPDNRKMMRFTGLDTDEEHTRETVRHLITERRSSLPLLYGDYIPLYNDADVLCFERVYMGQKVLVALNRADEAREIRLPNGAVLEIEGIGYVIR